MITFIVSAFNEAGNITPTVETICSAAAESNLNDFEIIIVNDGSVDGTEIEIIELVKAYPFINSITNSVNMGLGVSVRKGIDKARHPAFMVVPGDNDMPIGMILMMLNFRGEAQAILTAPLNKEQRNLSRNIISMFYQIAYTAMFGVYVSYINGPGIWPTAAAREAGLNSSRFSIISELNVKILRMGSTFAEVPGYFQAGPKVRSTVTFRNLAEVVTSFVRLALDIHVYNRGRFNRKPERRQIDFVSRFPKRTL